VFATQALGLAVAVMRSLGAWESGAPAHRLATPFFMFQLGALFVLLATLCADEAVSRGARPARAYPVALLIASIITAVTQWYGRLWFGPSGMPIDAQGIRLVLAGLDVGLLGGLAMLAYVNRRIADQILEGVREAELRRVRLERQLIESRLAAAEAQVDPQTLFGALADIRNGFERAAPDADRRLGNLIQDLRAALARTTIPTEPGAGRP
jgi:hypothetical protein